MRSETAAGIRTRRAAIFSEKAGEEGAGTDDRCISGTEDPPVLYPLSGHRHKNLCAGSDRDGGI